MMQRIRDYFYFLFLDASEVTPLATASLYRSSLKSNVRFKNKAKIKEVYFERELSPTPSIVKTFRYAADVPAWGPARPKDLPKHAGEEAPLACRDSVGYHYYLFIISILHFLTLYSLFLSEIWRIPNDLTCRLARSEYTTANG